MIATLIGNLAENVAAELAVQERIQELLDRQLEILLRGRTPDLAPVLASAEAELAASRALEQARVAILDGLSAELGVPRAELTLARLEELAGGPAALAAKGGADLVAKGGELKELLGRIRETNRRVGLLLRHSVLFLEDLVQAVTGGGARAPTYTRTGELRGGPSGALAAEA